MTRQADPTATSGMPRRRLPQLTLLASLLLPLLLPSIPALAQWKPTREIKVIVPAAPGGGSDQFVRQITRAAEQIDPSVKFVVENLTGGGGATGFTTFMSTKSDGHTFISVYPEIGQKLADGSLPYGVADIQPVMNAQAGPATLLGRADDPRFKSYDEMIAYMKKNNAELVVATYTLKGFDDVTLAAIEKKEGVRFKRLPYVKAGERFTSLIGGHVDLLTQRIGDVMNFVQSGQMKPILIDVPKRLEGFPDLPTFKDKGIPFELNYWRGIWAKSDTPKEAVSFLDDLLKRAMAEPGYAKYEKAGFYHLVPGYMNHDHFAQYVKREVAVYKEAYVGVK